ncbi:MAG: YihY/virulence factor BrkB family protein [Chitinispirillales bacterium]|jgi:membrane protein|nr:YihY/virulence factor BrkB family protein [Chitinispirillales bacterium]
MKNKILKDIFHDPGLAVEKAHRSKNRLLYITVKTVVFLRILFSEYGRNHCASRASGLAFVLLITLIPLITTAAIMFTSITDVHPEHVERVMSALLPFAPPAVMEHIITFFINARSLRGIGIGVLIIMTMSLFNTMEQSMNTIWKVPQARSFFTRLRTFTMVIVYSPFLFFASFQFRHSGIFGIVPQDIFILRFLPFALTTFAFALLFKFIPNTRVNFVSALLGGIAAGLLFELERRCFGYYVHFSTQTQTIFGAAGFLPFFLLSLYFTALLFLMGTQVSYVHQCFRPLLRSSRRWDRRVGDYGNYITLRIVIDCVTAFMKKQTPPDLNYFCEKYELTDAQATGILNWLVHENFIHQTHKNEQFVPAKDFSTVSLRTVFSAIIDQHCRIPLNPQDPAKEYLSKFMKDHNSHSHTDDMTFSELVEQLDIVENKSEIMENALAKA